MAYFSLFKFTNAKSCNFHYVRPWSKVSCSGAFLKAICEKIEDLKGLSFTFDRSMEQVLHCFFPGVPESEKLGIRTPKNASGGGANFANVPK
jgi:hypothetical protein